MIVKIWIDNDAIGGMLNRGTIVKDSRCDGVCFYKSAGFTHADLVAAALDCPTAIGEDEYGVLFFVKDEI